MNNTHNRNGQALMELVVGLVAILVLLAGLVQLVSLTRARTETLNEARRRAGLQAMSGAAAQTTAPLIRYWTPGPDDKPYTADDQYGFASAGRFRETVVEKTAGDPRDWQTLAAIRDNPVSRLHDGAVPTAEFHFVRGADRRSVELLPTVRDLLYNADTITLDAEIWMPSLGDLY